MTIDNERVLIKKYLKGDEKSLEVLIRRYLKPVYNFVFRYVGDTGEAEDITQQTFISIWRNLKKFNPEKNFKTWIFSIAKNASIDFLRKKKVLPFSQLEDERGYNPVIENLADPAPLMTEILECKDVTSVLSSAMEKLSPTYRTVLFLRYNDHFTFREIAEVLGEPLNTVKSRHRRAISLLKKFLL